MSHRYGPAPIDESERRALAALVEDRTGHDSGDETGETRGQSITTTRTSGVVAVRLVPVTPRRAPTRTDR